MQLLKSGSKKKVPPAGGGDDCAKFVLDVAPPVVRHIRELMRGHRLRGLSVPQFRALALLSWSPKTSLSNVADFIGSSLPAASRMIDGLVERKLVERRECDNDRRQVSLALTSRGAAIFHDSRRATQQQLAERLTGLSAAERKTVVEAMQLLSQIFGTDRDSIKAPAEKNEEERAGRAKKTTRAAGGADE